MSCVKWFGRPWLCFSSRPWSWYFRYSVFFNRLFVSVHADHGFRISMWSLCFLMSLLLQYIIFIHHWFIHDLVSVRLNLYFLPRILTPSGDRITWSRYKAFSRNHWYLLSLRMELWDLYICWYRILFTSKALGLSLYAWYLFIILGYSESIPRIQATSGLLFA